ncbi:MAG: ATP-binding protein, partial [Verrucomicrobiota bacterium]
IDEQWRHALKTGELFEVECRLYCAEGHAYRYNVIRANPVRSDVGHIIKWCGTHTDITQQKVLEEERDRALQVERELWVKERLLRAKETAASRRLAFLAEASAILASSLDYATTLRNVVELAVPQLADWCSVEVLQENGAIHPIAVAHKDPGMLDLAQELRRDYPARLDEARGVARVIGTGRSELYPMVSDTLLRSSARDARHLDLLRRLVVGSAMIVPLSAQGRTFGAMTMLVADPARAFTAEDLAFAENLALRAALSVENARLFHEAKRANEIKDHFLAVLSHELRTPLTPVLMAASAIESDPAISAELRSDIAMIRRNVELEARLIDDLLDHTRFSAGKLQIHASCVDANELAAQAELIVRSEAASNQPHVTLELGAVRSHVQGDPARLQQIFWNLLKNAVKFTPASGRVRMVTSNPTAECWRIQVIDSGKGIAPELLPRIFEAFEQGEEKVTRTFGGLGLGLAISRALAILHGGELRAESGGAGAGAVFTFELPLDPNPVLLDKPLHAVAAQSVEGIRILLVEDHETTGLLMERLLKKRGHFPRLARSKSEALALAASHRFDVLVSDLGLPDGTGFELMDALRAGHALPGIALSGYGMEADVSLSLQSGFQRHLTKPVDIEQLDAALRELLGPRVMPSEGESYS